MFACDNTYPVAAEELYPLVKQQLQALVAGARVSCPDCGVATVEKALMAPRVRPARQAAGAPEDAPAAGPAPAAPARPAAGPLSTPANPREAAIAEMRRMIEANSEYVGLRFAAEARKMHTGEIPDRLIHGEARPEDARALLDEGVHLAPLPFLPSRKAN